MAQAGSQIELHVANYLAIPAATHNAGNLKIQHQGRWPKNNVRSDVCTVCKRCAIFLSEQAGATAKNFEEFGEIIHAKRMAGLIIRCKLLEMATVCL